MMQRPATTRDGASTRYTVVAVVLHWGIAALILVGISLGLYASDLQTTTGAALINLHKLVGLTVLLLTLARIGWRLGHRPPPLPAAMAPLLRWLAHGVHAGLYALMLLLPLSGWLMTSSFPGRHPIQLGTLATIPFLPVTPDMAVASASAAVHQSAAWLMIALLTLHIAAVLKHTFLDRDRLLLRMIPRLGSPPDLSINDPA